MAVFISHSPIDEGMFSGLRAGLRGQGVPTWNPESMGTGLSRRDQLREAIGTCDVCIFMMTGNSLKDSWCTAEVGAFWGAGKRVIVFRADSNVTEDQTPPQLQGDVSTSNFEKVVEDVQKIILEADEKRRQEKALRPMTMAEMPVETFYDALVALRSAALNNLPPGEAMLLIQAHLARGEVDLKTMQPLIASLVKVPRDIIEVAAINYWQKLFTLTTDTGEWYGFANEFAADQAKLIDVYTNCLLVFYKDKFCASVAAARAVVVQGGKVRYDGLIADPASVCLGAAQQLLAKGDAKS